MTIQVFKKPTPDLTEFATVMIVLSHEDAANLWKEPWRLPVFTKRIESRIANELAIPESMIYPPSQP